MGASSAHLDGFKRRGKLLFVLKCTALILGSVTVCGVAAAIIILYRHTAGAGEAGVQGKKSLKEVEKPLSAKSRKGGV